MIDILICEDLKKACPEMTLGYIQAHVDVGNSPDSLHNEIDNYCDVLKREIYIDELAALKRIKDGRELYKKFGKAPSKYRLSSEALIRRVLQGKGIYKINNIVDINNLISLKSKFPVGPYNINNLHSPLSLTIGKKGEQYKGIGKELINIENLPVLTDSISSFGSPTSDSESAMMTNNVHEILMCIYSFSGKADIDVYLEADIDVYLEADIDVYLEYGIELLERYANGKDIKIKIIS